MSNGAMLAVRVLVAALATGTIVYAWYWYLHDAAGIAAGILLAVPIVWRLLVAPVRSLRSEGLAWLSQRSDGARGPSYEFDSVPIRVQRGESGLRFRAEDVVLATKLQGIPSQGRGYVDLATIEKWLGKRREPAARRFIAWARKTAA